MTKFNTARRIRRAAWTIAALCVPVLIHASESIVPSKFIASGNQAYVEVKVDGALQKIYTEHNGDYKSLLVLGERNNHELLQFSFPDSSKRIVTYVLEFRTEKDNVSPGLKVAGSELIKSLSSEADGFKDWQSRFSSFPDQPTGSAVMTDPSFADPVGVDIVDGDQIVLGRRMSDLVCYCQRGSTHYSCIIDSAIRCALDNLCTVFECLEAGEWSPSCHDALQAAKACLGIED
jgi:hypothetical protein